MSSRQPEPQLDNLLRAYVRKLTDWPMSEEAIDRFLRTTIDDRYTDEELREKASRVIATADDRRAESLVPVVETCGTLPLFGVALTEESPSSTVLARRSAQQLVNVVREAFLRVSDGDSTDKAVADPDKNALFIQECWKIGAQSSQFTLNRTLFYIRKNNLLGPVPGVRPYRVPRRELDQYLFASELALRLIQDEEYYDKQAEVTLDDILCDPSRSQRFEEIARRLAPGFSSLDYRWAALGIRKAQQRRMSTRGLHWPRFEHLGRTASISLSHVPTDSGFFWLQCEQADIFIGHTSNLREQLDRLFATPDAGTKVIPRWVGDREYRNMEIAIAPFAAASPSKREPFKRTLVIASEPLCNTLPKGEAVA